MAGGSPSGVSCGVYLEQVKQHLRDALALREFGGLSVTGSGAGDNLVEVDEHLG